MAVLAIDAGTTGVTALIIAEDGSVAARGYQEFRQYFPQPGWVEHEPAEIWHAVLVACEQALSSGSIPAALGITNQRETVAVWDRQSLTAPRPAIVWQDRRTTQLCTNLINAGHQDRVSELTGLRLDPYFSGTKLRWLAEHESELWAKVHNGRYAIGTIDSYLIAQLTNGRAHLTDASNASRTLLYDTFQARWSPELCELFAVPLHALPDVVSSSRAIAMTEPEAFLGLRIPIAGIAGDQQAALFGQAALQPGTSKCTFGTGSFVLVNTGPTAVRAGNGLLTTIAWDLGSGPTYALEGAIFVTGAAVQWLRDGLGIIENAANIEQLAASVDNTGGVIFVPALTGLGAPDWDPRARGLIVGITRGTGRAELARATLEAIAFEVRDVVDAMVSGSGIAISTLAVDGGGSANNLLCQLTADQLGVPVRRPVVTETTSLGAAFLAGLGAGVWTLADLAATWQLDQEFTPNTPARGDGRHDRWREAVARAKAWA